MGDPHPAPRDGAQWQCGRPGAPRLAWSGEKGRGPGSRGFAGSEPLPGSLPAGAAVSGLVPAVWRRTCGTGRQWDLGSTPPSALVKEEMEAGGRPERRGRGGRARRTPWAAGWRVPCREHLSATARFRILWPRVSGPEEIWVAEETDLPKMCEGTPAGERCSRDARCGASRRSPFPRLWREARSPPRPFLALYLDAAAQSWDLTFLSPRRPGDPRKGALRASAGSARREDAES